jgi:deoxycytidine triphosphate deaminase
MQEITLDVHFRVMTGEGPVDPEAYVGYDDFVELVAVRVPPNGFVLGRSVERVCVPERMLGVVFACSTLLRCGLAFGCGFVQPGFEGHLTLELGNLNKHRALRLHVGKPVAHLRTFPATDLPRYAGRYAEGNPMGPRGARQ